MSSSPDPQRGRAAGVLASFLEQMLGRRVAAEVAVTGAGALRSVHPVTELAAAAIAAAGIAVRRLCEVAGHDRPGPVVVDRRLASLWFGSSVRPLGWDLPTAWDRLAGDYRTADGWIRLHTNVPAHRSAAIDVLGCPPEPGPVGEEVARWRAEELEVAVVTAGGCAAALRTPAEWERSDQGGAVATEPLVAWTDADDDDGALPTLGPLARPLGGVRVLDLTRVLAGPVATRFLGMLGAQVLRVDPHGWDEPALIPDVMAAKRSTRLDLRSAGDRVAFTQLLAGADVLVHGLRPGALDGLGYDPAERRRLRPGLLEVSLSAYGHTGPWAGRRGFDSLVQMSTGIAHEAMAMLGRDRPTPLPVQALDHATGYLMAAATLESLAMRASTGRVRHARLSLARTAALLTRRVSAGSVEPLLPEHDGDLATDVEDTGWGPARRLRPPLTVPGVQLEVTVPARPLGGDQPAWAA